MPLCGINLTGDSTDGNYEKTDDYYKDPGKDETVMVPKSVKTTGGAGLLTAILNKLPENINRRKLSGYEYKDGQLRIGFDY